MKNLIAANWKMNKTNEEAVALVKELTPLVKDAEADVVVCPSFTVLKDVADELKGSNIKLGAQNMHYEDSGAFTGDVSPLMLKSVGCGYVILGHSDRREIFKEDDALIDKKVISALKHALKPILCVGENFDQKEKGIANDIIETQLKNCLKGLDNQQMKDVSIAYEPIWAISRGNPNVKPATKEDAEQRHQFVRSVLNNLFDENTSKNTRILYGGSMKAENAKELLAMPDINGGLVGNASLKAKGFAEIVKAGE